MAASAPRRQSQSAPADNADADAFSVYTLPQRRAIVALVAFAAFFSPLTSNIYYPAVNDMARDLQVSSTAINFSFTSYMISQGVAPMFIADFTDSMGRRPAYIVCFGVFLVANIGLALQHNLGALIALRVVQAAGSSGTAVLANVVVSDIATSSERGSYLGYTFAGAFVGQSVGPLIGGLLAYSLGWRSIFWFLTILAGSFFILLVLFLPETARKLVGNGSKIPSGVNMNVLDLAKRSKTKPDDKDKMMRRPRIKIPNPFAVLSVLRSAEAAALLLYAGLVFAGLAVLAVAVPSLFQDRFHFNSLQIGLSFIPSGVGGCLAAAVCGRLADLNFRRHATKLGLRIDKKRAVNFAHFPIELTRVEVVLPLAVIAVFSTLSYGWVLQYTSSIIGPLILLFFIGFASAGMFDVMSTLLLDIEPARAAQVSACNNLVRCGLGAGASVIATPMVRGVNTGWTYTIVGLVWLILQPLAFCVVSFGPRWRAQKVEEEDVIH